MWKSYQHPLRTIRKRRHLKTIALFVKILVGLYKVVLKKRPLIQIFYATETGTAKYFAEKLHKMFEKTFNAIILDMSQ